MARGGALRTLQAAFALGLLAFGFAVATRGEAMTDRISFLPIAALVGAASAAYLALRADLAWTFSVGIALSVFSGNAQYMGLPVSPDRIVLAFAMAVLLWRSSRFSSWSRNAGPRAGLPFGVTHWLIVLALGYAVVSAAWAGTLFEHDGFYGLLDRFGVVPFVLFLVAPRVFATDAARSALIVTLVMLGVYLGGTAIAEGLNLNALVFPRYILDPTIGIHADRARGPFVEAVANGLALFACGVAAAVAMSTWRRLESRCAAAAVLVLCVVGVVLTLTRAVWVASVVAPLAAMLCSAPLRRRVLPAGAAAAVIVLVALAGIPGLTASAQSRAETVRPVWDRLNTDAAALRMVEQRPLLGFGWDTFVTRGPDYLRQKSDFPLTGVGLNVHNVLLSHAVELGLLGFALWAGAFVCGIVGAAVRRAPPALEPWRIALIALALNWLIVASFGPLGYAFPTLLLWTWAGVVTAPSERPTAGASA
jgi:putative inorganic carbon (hco3(-)) transporter